MAEKHRRRVRARVLGGLTRASSLLPHALVRASLESLAPLARLTRYQRITLSNLELALGAETTPAERRRIAAGVHRHAARLLAEWIRLSHSAPVDSRAAHQGAWIERAVEIDPSISILESELAHGRGALVVTAHIGNWELLAARLARLGHQGAVIAFERPNDSTARWLTQMRRAYGVTTLPQHAHPREILRVLRQGGVIGLLADLEVRRLSGEFVPFFGIPALTMTAPAALARAAGVPLIPACCVRAGRVHRLRFEEPLNLDRTGARRAATLDLCARLNRVFESWIRADPEQWAWHQPRWRTRPGQVLPLRTLREPRGPVNVDDRRAREEEAVQGHKSRDSNAALEQQTAPRLFTKP